MGERKSSILYVACQNCKHEVTAMELETEKYTQFILALYRIRCPMCGHHGMGIHLELDVDKEYVDAKVAFYHKVYSGVRTSTDDMGLRSLIKHRVENVRNEAFKVSVEDEPVGYVSVDGSLLSLNNEDIESVIKKVREKNND